MSTPFHHRDAFQLVNNRQSNIAKRPTWHHCIIRDVTSDPKPPRTATQKWDTQNHGQPAVSNMFAASNNQMVGIGLGTSRWQVVAILGHESGTHRPLHHDVGQGHLGAPQGQLPTRLGAKRSETKQQTGPQLMSIRLMSLMSLMSKLMLSYCSATVVNLKLMPLKLDFVLARPSGLCWVEKKQRANLNGTGSLICKAIEGC